MSEMNTYHSLPSTNPRPELSAKPVDKRPAIFGIIAAVVVILIFGGLGVWLFFNPNAAAVLRDIFIIYLGLGAFLIVLLLIMLIVMTSYLILKINDLIRLLEREVKPVLWNVQEATTKVKGTTTFISEHAVRPVITTVSTVSAVKAIFRALFRR
ncbi:MAG: hypothetical protein D6784_16585 [Chloroflexi bacterium]|nr:MAG: hypothetical protein D6784_16585 [Chloroflexota bacterium]